METFEGFCEKVSIRLFCVSLGYGMIETSPSRYQEESTNGTKEI